ARLRVVLAREQFSPPGLVYSAGCRSQPNGRGARPAGREPDKAANLPPVPDLGPPLATTTHPSPFPISLPVPFSVVGLVLALAGIYGVMHYWVAQRPREIGIRMAIGAGQRAVLGLVIKEGVKLSLTGIMTGLGSALILTRLMGSLLFGVSPSDPLTF